MYDPTLGRFLQRDSVGFTAGDSNLYRYVRDNPANGSDPTGKYLLAKDKQSADAIVKYLDEFYGIKAEPFALSDGKYYIHVDPKDPNLEKLRDEINLLKRATRLLGVPEIVEPQLLLDGITDKEDVVGNESCGFLPLKEFQDREKKPFFLSLEDVFAIYDKYYKGKDVPVSPERRRFFSNWLEDYKWLQEIWELRMGPGVPNGEHPNLESLLKKLESIMTDILGKRRMEKAEREWGDKNKPKP
jgi:hypothetical protein